LDFFQRWIIIRSGFRQHRGNSANGCVNILGRLGTQYGGNGNRIELQEWDDSPSHTADYIYRLSDPKNPPQVALFGYSWGCGYGVVRLAKELRRKQINVRYAVLCDPVYHGLARWRALIPRGLFSRVRIVIPSNVEEVFWLRQKISKPAGHDIVRESRYTTIHPPQVLQVRHTEMDNAPEFFAKCQHVAACLMGSVGAQK